MGKDTKRTRYAGVRLLLAIILAALYVGGLQAQEIRIKLLDGRNGHPLRDCVSIWTSSEQREPLLMVRTGKDGIAVLRLRDEHAVAPSGQSLALPCKNVPTVADLPRAETIGLSPDWDIDCRPFHNSSVAAREMKFYAVDRILNSGVAVDNSCGEFKTEPRRGELILYVRPPHWWEASRR